MPTPLHLQFRNALEVAVHCGGNGCRQPLVTRVGCRLRLPATVKKWEMLAGEDGVTLVLAVTCPVCQQVQRIVNPVRFIAAGGKKTE